MGNWIEVKGKCSFNLKKVVDWYSAEHYFYKYDIAGLQSKLEHNDWNKRANFESIPRFNIWINGLGRVNIEFSIEADVHSKVDKDKVKIIKKHIKRCFKADFCTGNDYDLDFEGGCSIRYGFVNVRTKYLFVESNENTVNRYIFELKQ